MDLPDPGIEFKSPALAGGFFTTEPPGKPFLNQSFVFPLAEETEVEEYMKFLLKSSI